MKDAPKPKKLAALLLLFDDADNLVDVELITQPEEVIRYSMVRDAAWHHAVPYEQFAADVAEKE